MIFRGLTDEIDNEQQYEFSFNGTLLGETKSTLFEIIYWCNEIIVRFIEKDDTFPKLESVTTLYDIKKFSSRLEDYDMNTAFEYLYKAYLNKSIILLGSDKMYDRKQL